ncbi:potassium channel family protein [Streptomyces sp. 900116325]
MCTYRPVAVGQAGTAGHTDGRARQRSEEQGRDFLAGTGVCPAAHQDRWTVASPSLFSLPGARGFLPVQQSFFALLLGRLLTNRWWRTFHARAALSVSAATAAVLLAGAALVVPAEEGVAGANITSFPKAVWWSIETATTVGYGDLYPVTAWGRVIASVMMLAGITTFGMVTASIATWFVGRAEQDAQHVGRAVRRYARHGEEVFDAELRALHDRFDRVERLLEGNGER